MPSSSRGALPPSPTAALSEARGLRWLLVIGAVMVGAICAVEWTSGVINPWDRWMQPALAFLLLGFAGALTWWPRYTEWLRLGAVLSFNAYLAGTLLALMLWLPPPVNTYQFYSTAYWLPLSYGTAFVFLRARVALFMCGGIVASLALPLAAVALKEGPAYWGPDMPPLLGVLGIGQIAYILLLNAIATLRAHAHRSEEHARLMQALATTDALTGLPNRRALLEHLDAARAAVQRHGEPVCVALIDVDHFKSINDRFGHAAGDRVLEELGACMNDTLRRGDRLGRWGGEELLLICTHTPLVSAGGLAERLRANVEGHAFGHGAPVTVSIGLAQIGTDDNIDAVLERADTALYRAKQLGRNRVVEWRAPAQAPRAAEPATSA